MGLHNQWSHKGGTRWDIQSLRLTKNVATKRCGPTLYLLLKTDLRNRLKNIKELDKHAKWKQCQSCFSLNVGSRFTFVPQKCCKCFLLWQQSRKKFSSLVNPAIYSLHTLIVVLEFHVIKECLGVEYGSKVSS